MKIGDFLDDISNFIKGWLRPPTSFSEGQRALYGCAVVFAGMFAGSVCLLFIWIFYGGVIKHIWPAATYTQIITILGYGFAGFIISMIAVILTLAVGGPVGRFKGGASLTQGVNLDVSNNDPAMNVTTTVTTPVATTTTTTPIPSSTTPPAPSSSTSSTDDSGTAKPS